MNRGWFSLHRKIFESDVWQHPTARIVWIYILGTVVHKTTILSERYQAVTLQPAQMLTSQARIAAKCRLSRQETRSALMYLKSTNRITIEPTMRFTIITVTNWPAYRDAQMGEQPTEQPSDQPLANQEPTNSQPHIRSKEVKEKPVGVADADAHKGKPKPKVKVYYDEHGIPYPVLPARPEPVSEFAKEGNR